MPLKETTLFGIVDKVDLAIRRLKEFEPPEGYYLAFSGGKDSIVIKALADRAGVKYDAHYNVTTIDPPELIYFMRDHHPDVNRSRPEMPLLSYMVKKKLFPPLRMQRWCCRIYKESGGAGRKIVTGIRWAESSKRSKRKMVESCFRDKTKVYVNPIIDWEDSDVWQFIHDNNIPYCNLYNEGFKRLGCIGCPMAYKTQRARDMKRWPGYERLFRKSFRRLYKVRVERGMGVDTWADGDAFYEWWIKEERKIKEVPDQKVMFE